MERLPATTSAMSLYMNNIKQYPLLSKDEEFELAVRWYEDNDIEAAHKLVVSNLRFVVKIAYEYKDYGQSVLEHSLIKRLEAVPGAF